MKIINRHRIWSVKHLFNMPSFYEQSVLFIMNYEGLLSSKVYWARTTSISRFQLNSILNGNKLNQMIIP